MSENMDKDIFNMDEIDDLMSDMFEPKIKPAHVRSDDTVKFGGGLESFLEEEKLLEEKIEDWENNGGDSGPKPLAYKSAFGDVGNHNLSNQYATNNDIAFEKDEQNSSLAGVKVVTGLEDIHDFFAVNKDKMASNSVELSDIDKQVEDLQKLSAGELADLEQEFVEELGINKERYRKLAGATSAWQEIRAIRSMLDDMELEAKRTRHRFEKFIDAYVKQHIPK